MSGSDGVEIIDVTDDAGFGRLPPCVNPRFDHRSCDYWEDEVRGSKASRPSWWQPVDRQPSATTPRSDPDNPFVDLGSDDDDFNPFAPTAMAAALDPLAGDDLFATPSFNPFAPTSADNGPVTQDGLRKMRLLGRGRTVFGSYAKILLVGDTPTVYAQFGPLSAYPRAQAIRELYPQLPDAPLPAVVTCIAAIAGSRGSGMPQRLIEAIRSDLAGRGFAAIEAYPDLTLSADEASAARPAFWQDCGFDLAVNDDRYPVMRLGLT